MSASPARSMRTQSAAGRSSMTETDETIRATLKQSGYLLDPHTATAVRVARAHHTGSPMVVLGTAHPAKFKESVEEILQETLPLPKELADRADLPLLSHNLPADFAALRKLMMG